MSTLELLYTKTSRNTNAFYGSAFGESVLVYFWLKLAMYICILGIGLAGLCGA